MEIPLPFAGRTVLIDTEKSGRPLKYAGRFTCSFPVPLEQLNIEKKIKAGLSSYFGSDSKSKILTIVNDGYRRTPTEQLLTIVWPYIKDGDFIIATGTHRQPKQSELETIFGRLIGEVGPRLQIHNCYDSKSLVDFGRTTAGTVVKLHRAVAEADLIFTINSVEPHFFAGFTGGRKSIVPGLASFETVQANHRWAKDIHACTLNLDTNPLHLDLEDAVSLIKNKALISIQCVTDRHGAIIELYAGPLSDAFKQACQAAAKWYTVNVPRKYDIVIANCEPPLDVNLYQLQKAQEHGGRMVASGGVLITMGECAEGTGSEYFMRLADKYPAPESALNEGIDDDSFGIHKLVKTARQLREFKVYYVTALDEKEVRKVYFEPFGEVETALERALCETGPGAELAILDDAGYSVPVIEP